MSGIELNKICGAVLLAMLIAMVAGKISHGLVPTSHGEHGTEERQLAFAPPMVEATETAAATEEADPAVETLMASADPAAGAAVFKKCAACHTVEKGGANKVGPALWSILGRDIASHEGFGYSDALKGKDGDWSYDALYHFLKSPKGWAPGTKMGFAGLKKPADRADIIAYLRSLADSPVPLPQ